MLDSFDVKLESLKGWEDWGWSAYSGSIATAAGTFATIHLLG
jgi:hypothetical protein